MQPFILILFCLIIVVISVNASQCKVDSAVLHASKSVHRHHWQLGTIIRNQSSTCRDCLIVEVGMTVFNSNETGKMVFTQTILTVDPTQNKVTTWTQPANKPVIPMKGCIETIFMRDTDAGAVKRKFHNEVKQHMMVIFMARDLSKLEDDAIFRAIARRNVTVGFFSDAEVSDKMRNRLLHYGTPFLENLARPNHSEIKELLIEETDKVYHSFLFVFSPLAEETSLPDSMRAMQPPRKINLADLVVFSPVIKTIEHRCLKKAEVSLSHGWGPASHVPVAPYVMRPQIRDSDSRFSFFDHYSTHIDAPYHFGSDKNDITTLPNALHEAMHCIKVEIPYNGVGNFSIKKEHLIEWEKTFGTIPASAMILLDTGFGEANWGNVKAYQHDWPGLSVEAARFLVEERKALAIGIDSLLIDDYSLEAQLSYPTHAYLAGTDTIAIENIGGHELAKFPRKGGVCLLSYLRVEKGSGGPVAVFGLKPSRLNGGFFWE